LDTFLRRIEVPIRPLVTAGNAIVMGASENAAALRHHALHISILRGFARLRLVPVLPGGA